jgi:L-Lysine epsilon oxidase N-terminal/L-lysine epsilon oxidase C-terminal domain
MANQHGIVRAAIHPAIGIARVGGSREEFLIGPELPYPVAADQGGAKDPTGALKRQAARFRIYGYDAAGHVVREITCEDAAITWRVHLANKKAAWYCFETALDLPDAAPAPRRNAAIVGDARRQLVIDPGPRPISGASQPAGAAVFDSGQFFGAPVYLGELRTDTAGRLLVLGGHGHSASVAPHDSPSTFANNDGWHDDTSDGPVEATVVIDGQSIPVDPAWVVVAPPSYAPDLIAVQTMYDVLYDTFQDNWLRAEQRPSFTRHIAPLLQRFCDQQWANYGFFVQFGWGGPNEFTRPDLWRRLASSEPQHAELRHQIATMFRNPRSATLDVEGWPPMYGDDMGAPTAGARQMLAITKTQYDYLQQWARGDAIDDWDARAAQPPQQIEQIPVAQQPATLDEAALTFCLGGPFHPGCEMTWPMRHVRMYRAPFRLRMRPAAIPEPDYGETLDPAALQGEAGPLLYSGPGDLTRWMAVPWQTDTASCQSGYDPQYDAYLPTFWPARVPNHVLRADAYQTLMRADLPIAERMAAFERRVPWMRGFGDQYLDQIRRMVGEYDQLGVLERRPGPEDTSAFPSTLLVESAPGIGDADRPDAHTPITHGAVEKSHRRRRAGQRSHIQPRSGRS